MESSRRMPLFQLLLVLGLAHLSSGYVVFQETFEGDEEYFLPTQTWTGSYCDDAWRTDLNGGITSRLDDGCEYCGCNMAIYSSGAGSYCQESDPFDNHIQAGNPLWADYTYTVKVRNDDDDSMGVVFRYVRSNEYYLFLVTGDQMPDVPSGCSGTAPGAHLMRMAPGGDKILKSDASIQYVPGTVHLVRIAVKGTHIRIEFDANGDGIMASSEVFFDGQDSDGKAILQGRIGLYAFENGAEEYGEPSPCYTGGCYFDDLTVELDPTPVGNCGDVSVEGLCSGNTAQRCTAGGEIVSQNCGLTSCCRYDSYAGVYGCAPGTSCLSCSDSCGEGQGGCSANLTHRWVCATDGDSDGCLEPRFEACPGGGSCNPATGQCGDACMPMCDSKECGPDGCGGVCGFCGDNQICQANGKCVPNGTCVPDCGPKECGNDGCGGSCGTCNPGYGCTSGMCKGLPGAECTLSVQCATGLCLPLGSDQVCTQTCNTDADCPQEWTCITWLMGSPARVCAPVTQVVNLTCADAATCVGQCGSNANCVSTCYLATAPEQQGTYAALFQCIMSNCADCEDSGCYNLCSIDKCFQPFAECFPGTLSCEETLKCIQSCPGGDQACSSNCLDQSMPAAKKQLLDLFGCLETACEGSQDSSCTSTALAGPCKDAYDSCLSGCDPQCTGYECGNDGCGGSCGTCESGSECSGGTCVVICTPSCLGRDCGDDGCGGVCGVCEGDQQCLEGVCSGPMECTTHNEVRCVGSSLYWFDSCGKKEDLAKNCTYGCQKGDCQGKDSFEDVIEQDGTDGWTDEGDAVVFGAGGNKSSGCAAGVGDHAGGLAQGALALLLVAGVWMGLRRRRAA